MSHDDTPRKRSAQTTKQEKILVAASGFTGGWGLTWLGAEALAVTAAVHGGFAAGSIVASSGLALLWWKTSAVRGYQQAGDEDETPVDEASVHEPAAEGVAPAASAQRQP